MDDAKLDSLYLIRPTMRMTPRTTSRLLLTISFGVALGAGLYAGWRVEFAKSHNKTYESLEGWQPISGRWAEHGGVLSNSNYGRGDMLIAQRSQGGNYRISADLRFDLLFSETHYGDAGLVIRTSDPEQGVDSYQGYYAGLRPDDQTVVLGRSSYDWRQLEVAKLASPVVAGAWYRLELSADKCMLTVTVRPVPGGQTTRISHLDDQCLTEGVAGLRSFYAQASWRNVEIARN